METKEFTQNGSCNVLGICHEEDQSEDNLVKKNIHIAVIAETTRKPRYSKETNHCIQVRSGVNWKTRAQAEVMILISNF
jgi:hypothetical protein